MAWLRSAPAVASEFEVEILPYSAEGLRTQIRSALGVENESRDHALSHWARSLAYFIGSEPDWGVPLRTWAVTNILERLPARDWPDQQPNGL